MLAASFISVSATGTFTLGDLSVSGYTPPVWDEDNEEPEAGTGVAGGDFVVQVLNSSGGADARYYWIDDGNPAGKGKGWYTNGAGSTKADTDTEIAAGQGLWVQGKGYKLYIPAPEL